MSKHYNQRPDHTSVAFELASKEFSNCGGWTRQDAIQRLNENKRFQAVVKIEPRLSGIISEALKVNSRRGYDRDKEYDRLKGKTIQLVGYEADKDELGDSDSFDLVVKVIVDLLPPDAVDLYPNGLPELENSELDL